MAKQQIIISGLGGQGAVTLSRLLGEAALALGWPVLTSETHGMAQRGGAVISMVKVGAYRSPLILSGTADVGLFLHAPNLAVHGHYLKAGGYRVVNSPWPGEYLAVDGVGQARLLGLPLVSANLILLGYAAGLGLLFCKPEALAAIVRDLSPEDLREGNLKAFQAGVRLGEKP